MIQITEPMLEKMVESIVREVDPERIVLFGSRARGDAGEESDIDLLVVEREPFGPGRSRLAETNRISRSIAFARVPTDVLLYSAEEVEKWRDSVNHVIGRCRREGRVLYERS
jgi:uncharacterized protein